MEEDLLRILSVVTRLNAPPHLILSYNSIWCKILVIMKERRLGKMQIWNRIY